MDEVKKVLFLVTKGMLGVGLQGNEIDNEQGNDACVEQGFEESAMAHIRRIVYATSTDVVVASCGAAFTFLVGDLFILSTLDIILL